MVPRIASARFTDTLIPHLRVLGERPLFPFAVYLCLGIASCSVLPVSLAAGLAAVIVFTIVVLVVQRKRRGFTFPAMLLALATGYALVAAALPRWAGDPWEPAGQVPLSGRIVEARKTSGGYDGYVLDDLAIGGNTVEGKAVVTVLRGTRTGSSGDVLIANTELARPEPSLYFGGFNARGWYMRQGVRFTGFAPAASVEEAEHTSSWLDFPEQARQAAHRTLYRYLKPDDAALVNALLSGETGGIDAETRRDFMDLGVAHLLAVSGLNISLTAGAAWLLCRKLRLPMPVSLAISFLVMSGYVLFAGLTPSVLRAAAMWLVAMGALVFARRYDPLSSLAAAAILILFVNPLDLFDAGFQLSFAATAAMFLWVAPVLRHVPDRKWMKGFAGAAGVTVCVTVVALPVILGYFNNVSLISVLANLVLVPASFVMQLAGTALLFVGFAPDVASLLGGMLDGYTSFYLYNVKMLSWSAATLPAATPPGWLSAAYMALVLLVSPSIARFRPGGRGRVVVLATLVLAAIVMLSPASAALSWQSAAAIVAEGRSSLSIFWRVDGKNYAACTEDWAELSGYLASRAVNHLDGLYVLADVPPVKRSPIEPASWLRVDRLYVPEGWFTDPACEGFLSRAAVLGVETLPVGDGPFECIGAESAPVALLVPVGEAKITFVAKATKKAVAMVEESLGDGCLMVLAARPGKNSIMFCELPLQSLVLPGTIADAGYPRYNITDAGSIEIKSRGGALALVPWIGGWADGLQGNFR